MKIKFLGTAAGEGWPALFCECEVCKRAEQLGGKNIRTRSSCLIDDIYMVDFPPDTFMHKLRHNLKLSRIEHLFITHHHHDHFYPEDLPTRGDHYAHVEGKKLLNIYGNNKVMEKYNAIVPSNAQNVLKYNLEEPFKYFQAGDAKVMPLPANHDPKANCYIYIIELHGRVLLYGHDTGYFYEETWQEVEKHKFNGVILDCTEGKHYNRDWHMGMPNCVEVKNRLVDKNCTYKDTKFIITHFSHNGGLLHEDLEALAEKEGFAVAYDGFVTDI